MSTLLYRGHTYEHQPAAQKVCKQLSYRGQEYNTCTEQQPADLHPHLSYRGIGYDKSLEAEEECRLRNDRQSYFSLARSSNSQMNQGLSSSGKKLLIVAWMSIALHI